MEVESTSAAVPSQAAAARRPIGEFLVERGLVTNDQLAAALADQRESGKRLGEILVERGAITRMALASVLGEQWEEAGRHLRSVVPVRLAGGREAEGMAGGEELTDSLASLQAAVARLEDLSSSGPKHGEVAHVAGSDDGLAAVEAALAGLRSELAELRAAVAAPIVVEGDLAERLGELDSWLRERDGDAGAKLAQAVESLGARVDSLDAAPDLGWIEARLDELAQLVVRPPVETPAVDLSPLSARLDALVDLATRPAAPVPDPAVEERLDRIDLWLREQDGAALGASLEAAVERLGERRGAPADDELRERLARVEQLLTERADELPPVLARRLDEVEAAAKRPRDGSLVGRFERLEELLDRQPVVDTTELNERIDALQPLSEAAVERLGRLEDLLRESRAAPDDERLDALRAAVEDLGSRPDSSVSPEHVAELVGSMLEQRLESRDLTWEAVVERLGRLEDSLRDALASRDDERLEGLRAAIEELRARPESSVSPEHLAELVGSALEELLGRLEQSVERAVSVREHDGVDVAGVLGSALEAQSARLEERLGGRDLRWEAAVERLGRLEDSLREALAPQADDRLGEVRARLEALPAQLEELRTAVGAPRDREVLARLHAIEEGLLARTDDPERTADLVQASLEERLGSRDLAWEAAVERLGRLEDSLREALGAHGEDQLDEVRARLDALPAQLGGQLDELRAAIGTPRAGDVLARLHELEHALLTRIDDPERTAELVRATLAQAEAQLVDRLGGRDLAWEAAVERLGGLEESLREALAPRHDDHHDELLARLDDLRSALAAPRDGELTERLAALESAVHARGQLDEHTAERIHAALAESTGRLDERVTGRDLAWEAVADRLGRLETSLQGALERPQDEELSQRLHGLEESLRQTIDTSAAGLSTRLEQLFTHLGEHLSSKPDRSGELVGLVRRLGRDSAEANEALLERLTATLGELPTQDALQASLAELRQAVDQPRDGAVHERLDRIDAALSARDPEQRTLAELQSRLDSLAEELATANEAALEPVRASLGELQTIATEPPGARFLERLVARSHNQIAERIGELEHALRGPAAESDTAALAESEARIAELVDQLAAREAVTASEPAERRPRPGDAASFLALVPAPDGYRLVALEGTLPAPGEGLDVPEDERTLVVARLGRSPYPGDARPCAYLQAG